MGLREDILTLPPELLAQRDTQAIADALPSVGGVGRIERAEFAMWCADTGMRAKIEDHAANPASPLRSAALACRDVILGAANAIDFSLPGNAAMLGAWVAIGELSQDQADNLLAQATRYSKADEYDVRCVCWADNGDWTL